VINQRRSRFVFVQIQLLDAFLDFAGGDLELNPLPVEDEDYYGQDPDQHHEEAGVVV